MKNTGVFLRKAGRILLMSLLYILMGISYALQFMGKSILFITDVICYQDRGKR